MLSDLVRRMDAASSIYQGTTHLFRRLLPGSASQLKQVITVENVPTLTSMIFFVDLNLLESRFEPNIAASLMASAYHGTPTLCGFQEGMIEADLSGKKLGSEGAILVAWDLRAGFVSTSMTRLK